jgi:hypothetical protein
MSKSLFNSVNNTNNEEPLEIICDGDSWVFGSEIVDPEISKNYDSTVHPGVYDFEEPNDHYRRPRIFSTHLAKLMNANVVNLSWPADDNGSILRRTMEYISNEYIAKKRSTKNLLVIVGWSSPERNSFWYKDDIMSMNFRLWPQVPHFDSDVQKRFWEIYVAYLWHPEEYIRRYVLNVLQLQNFCQAHNINWMCFNSFYQTPAGTVQEWYDLDIRQEIQNLKGKWHGYQYQQTSNPDGRDVRMIDYTALWDTVDPVRFYKKDQPNNTFKSYIESPEAAVKDVFCGWHPSPEAHEAWAHELIRYIKENKII